MKRLFLGLRDAAAGFSRDGCGFLAQAIAFNALFTLFPLVVLVLTATSYVLPNAEQRVLGIFGTLASPVRAFLVANLQTYIYGRGISSLIAFAFIIWSAKNLFLALAYALNRALGIGNRPLVHDYALSLVMLPAIGLLLLIAIALPIVFSIIGHAFDIPIGHWVSQVGAYAISLALVFLVSIALYAFLPNRKLSWAFGIPGATFVALTWPLVQYAFAQYVVRVDFTRIYGALSAPLVLLLWFYIIGSIFLYGGQLCAVYSKNPQPIGVSAA